MSIDKQGPFGDPLFASMARYYGCHDEGRSWHLINQFPMHTQGTTDWALVGRRGIDTDNLNGLPSGMPRFRFARDKDGRPALMVNGGKYIFTNRDDIRAIAVYGFTLPETLLIAAPGRLLSEYVDIAGASEERIKKAEFKNFGITLTLA